MSEMLEGHILYYSAMMKTGVSRRSYWTVVRVCMVRWCAVLLKLRLVFCFQPYKEYEISN